MRSRANNKRLQDHAVFEAFPLNVPLIVLVCANAGAELRERGPRLGLTCGRARDEQMPIRVLYWPDINDLVDRRYRHCRDPTGIALT